MSARFAIAPHTVGLLLRDTDDMDDMDDMDDRDDRDDIDGAVDGIDARGVAYGDEVGAERPAGNRVRAGLKGSTCLVLADPADTRSCIAASTHIPAFMVAIERTKPAIEYFLKICLVSEARPRGPTRISLIAHCIPIMGLFDAFRGSKKPAESAAPSAEGTSSSSEITNANSEQFSSDGASSSTEGAFNSTTDFSPSFSDETRFYNPYAGISAALDKRDVKQGFVLPQEPQFLFVMTCSRSFKSNRPCVRSLS